MWPKDAEMIFTFFSQHIFLRIIQISIKLPFTKALHFFSSLGLSLETPPTVTRLPLETSHSIRGALALLPGRGCCLQVP